jgi:hypothetical protein
MSSQLTLSLDGDALREATVQAMSGVLAPEIKAKMLENAIRTILAPGTDSWSHKKSPLELAFVEAVIQIAHQEVKRLVVEDKVFCEKLNTLMRATADKILSTDIDKFAGRMADAFVASFRRD